VFHSIARNRPRTSQCGEIGNGNRLSIAHHVAVCSGPEQAIKKEADAALASIPGAPVASNNIELLKVYRRLIVDVLPRVDGRLGAIVRSPAAGNAQTLQRAVLEYGGKVEARALRFRLLLNSEALILLFYLLHQYRGLRIKARELRWKEVQLIQANKMTALRTLHPA